MGSYERSGDEKVEMDPSYKPYEIKHSLSAD